MEVTLQAQRSHWLCWAPVAMGCGLAIYFSISFEPTVLHVLALGGAILCLAFLAFRFGPGMSAVLWLIVLICLGFLLGSNRAHMVSAPVLQGHYYGPIEGRVIAIDRSASDAIRLTLDRVILTRIKPHERPHKVRISLHGDQHWITPKPHQWVGTTGHLSPPNGPVEPAGYDFQRYAWFQQLGAVGYTRNPTLVLRHAPETPSLVQFRYALAQAIQTQIGGEAGGIAAALITGVRSGLSPGTVQALRDTNLAHLLAISGLHMGLLASVVYWAVRFSVALLGQTKFRLPAKKIAASSALVAASGYLFVSGASIATERAFVMAGVALVAILLDRRVISLRAVAVAALIVLIRRPESILSPGFHMSFAATTALVVVFTWLRGKSLGPNWLKPISATVISSAVAGAATAPFAAAHFNMWASYGLLANLLAVPVMGLVVAPSAVLAAVLSLVGLESVALTVMRWGIEWILAVAHTFAGFDHARLAIVSPPQGVLAMLSLGLLFCILWQGRLRGVGAVPVICALVLWHTADRPDVLIADTGKLVGVLTPKGRVLSKEAGQGFVAARWLENDGDLVTQAQAAQRGGGHSPLFQIGFAGSTIWHISGKRAAKLFEGCQPGDVVVSAVFLNARLDCLLFDPQMLDDTGAIALWRTDTGLEIRSVAEKRGQRLWSPRPPDASKRQR